MEDAEHHNTVDGGVVSSGGERTKKLSGSYYSVRTSRLTGRSLRDDTYELKYSNWCRVDIDFHPQ